MNSRTFAQLLMTKRQGFDERSRDEAADQRALGGVVCPLISVALGRNSTPAKAQVPSSPNCKELVRSLLTEALPNRHNYQRDKCVFTQVQKNFTREQTEDFTP